MQSVEHISINGKWVTPQGTERFDLFNPATGDVTGQVRLANEADALNAIAAAKAAFPAWSQTRVGERVEALTRMREALAACEEELLQAIVQEYGAPAARAVWMARYPVAVIDQVISDLQQFVFTSQVGHARVEMTPLGVAGLITPWNSNAGFICGKLAAALAAGCTAVIKPSEMSAWQTQVVTRALHQAELPPGVFNIVTGRGEVVGEVMSRHPDIAKISFTGSTMTGKAILRNAADTFKRVTLELGGKSPTLILDDADPATAVPLAIQAGFINSGQACIAGTRILVPNSRKAEYEAALAQAVASVKSGDPHDPANDIGPMVSEKQWQRVQSYIRLGQQEGARVLAGGEGRPENSGQGWFVRPTLFTDVENTMRIAREEIFGPVLSVIGYQDDAHAVAIANDTDYGLSALVLGRDVERAQQVAAQIHAGRVQVNTLAHEAGAPFGGFKHSGIGREMGRWGLAAFMEPKTLVM
ncbi:Aldehyde dehydrogenase [Enterobacter sp. FY-07]|uniref:aldehyde dehydrogenase family protein n=1 Tax=Kosakonia oryzendophytica TaxID=1005665 RepID=UPI000776CC40|nr:aldehyde dehydrogenase family protein [Kosakonia oryzendophytica]AMO49410.1 Aldehyde dehydrogenase [Enterobacter sp. FY-07]WBT56133.1 aldehyde dehydrogenase family protein [Kosakonia oryzendophytica]